MLRESVGITDGSMFGTTDVQNPGFTGTPAWLNQWKYELAVGVVDRGKRQRSHSGRALECVERPLRC
ncbi:MAG: hypothetical protein ABJ249_09575 [Lentilitoribacter sp.]